MARLILALSTSTSLSLLSLWQKMAKEDARQVSADPQRAWLQLFAAIPGTMEYEIIRAYSYLSLVVTVHTVRVLVS